MIFGTMTLMQRLKFLKNEIIFLLLYLHGNTQATQGILLYY